MAHFKVSNLKKGREEFLLFQRIEGNSRQKVNVLDKIFFPPLYFKRKIILVIKDHFIENKENIFNYYSRTAAFFYFLNFNRQVKEY